MKIRYITAVAAMSVVVGAVGAPSASAAPAPVQACPEEILSAQWITAGGRPKTDNPPNHVGSVQVRTDNCGNYWTYVKIFHTLAAAMVR